MGEAQGHNSGIVQGTVLLGAAAMISKLLGTLQKIPLQNIGGDQAFGIYHLVYPLYTLILFLATAGFPTVVSIFVAERAVSGDDTGAKRILRIAATVLILTGILCFCMLFLGAGTIAFWMGDLHGETIKAIRSVSFALLFVPVMSALRGYFQGKMNMLPTAVSQVTEQIVRVTTMIVLLLYLTRAGYDDAWVASGATFGSVTGAVAGLAVMLYFWDKDRRMVSRLHLNMQGRSRREYDAEPTWPLVRRFIHMAIPVCIGAIALPVLYLVDSFTMPRLLGAGQEAITRIGLYNHGMTLVQLVALVAATLASALVPAVAEAKARGQASAIRVRTELAIRLIWLLGLGASAGLAILAGPLNIMFFRSDAGTTTAAVLAFTAAFSSLSVVSTSIMQGLGVMMAPVRNLLLAAMAKIALNILLIPHWGIDGAAWANVLAFALAAWLNVRDLRKHTDASLSPAAFLVKPLIAAAIMSACLPLCLYLAEAALSRAPAIFSYRAIHAVAALISVLAGLLIYVTSLFRTGAITEAELRLVPSASGKILPWVYKFRLLKKAQT